MAILERITKNVNNRFWDSEDWAFPVRNRYTVGVAGQKFFKELKDNAKIYGTRCDKCDITIVPGKLFCERCFEKLTKWVDVGTTGTVYTHTISYVEKDGSARRTPSIIAAVKIADGMIVHRLEGCKPDNVETGMKVKAVFKPKKDRTGSLLDISGFKPV